MILNFPNPASKGQEKEKEKNINFCPNCGAKIDGGKFCPECGQALMAELAKSVSATDVAEITKKTVSKLSAISMKKLLITGGLIWLTGTLFIKLLSLLIFSLR